MPGPYALFGIIIGALLGMVVGCVSPAGDDADMVGRFRTRNDDGSFGLTEIYSPDVKQ